MQLTLLSQYLLLLPALASALSIGRLTADASARLEPRRGGGGGKGGGGSKGGGSDGDGSGSSGSSGSRSGSTSYVHSLSFLESPTFQVPASVPNIDPRAAPSFNGGRSYPGGSTSSYVAGARSPSGLSASPILAGAALGFAGGALLTAGAYSYRYGYPYYYTDPNTHQNNSLPVDCFCAAYQPCGCDDPGVQSDTQATVGAMLQNSSVASVQTVNGSQAVVVNGTLPNGTDSGAVPLGNGQVGILGYAVMAAIVGGIVMG